MKYLALDLSTRTGWACGSEWETKGGVWKLGQLKRDGIGHCASSLAASLETALRTEKPDEVIYEAPLPSHSKGIAKDTMVARMQYGLCAVVEMICLECGNIPCVEASADEARKMVLGKALRGPSEWIKEVVMCWAIDQGHDPFDHNEADARLLHKYRCILGRSKIMAGAGSR